MTLDLPFSLTESALAGQPGNYQLDLHLDGREIAQIHFRLVSEAEIVDQIEVASFQLTASRHRGGAPVRCSHLDLHEHRELRIAFGVRAGFPAPGFALPARVEIVAGQRVLFSSDFRAPLNAKTTIQELKALPAAALWAKAGARDQTVHVRICVAGTVKCRHPLKLQLRAGLTNFEGSLTQDARTLGNVDGEYEAILQEVGG